MYRRAVSSAMSTALVIVWTAGSAVAGPLETKVDQRGARPDTTSFVWTNDEIDMLRSGNVPVSIFGQRAPSLAGPERNKLPYDRTKDPAWYAQQAAILRAEIDAGQADLMRQQGALLSAKNERQTDPGVAMDTRSAGITAEAGIENLQARVQEAQDQLDALADLAQHNGIPPGVLRG